MNHQPSTLNPQPSTLTPYPSPRTPHPSPQVISSHSGGAPAATSRIYRLENGVFEEAGTFSTYGAVHVELYQVSASVL